MKKGKVIVAELTIYTEGKTDLEVFKGSKTIVENHSDFTGTGALGKLIQVQNKSKIVRTTRKDFKEVTHRNHIKMEFNMDSWNYYSTVKTRKSKAGKTYVQNLPSTSTLRQNRLNKSDFSIKNISNKVKLTGQDKNLKLVNPDDLARFILFIEDVVSTVGNLSEVKKSDYKLNILESISH